MIKTTASTLLAATLLCVGCAHMIEDAVDDILYPNEDFIERSQRKETERRWEEQVEYQRRMEEEREIYERLKDIPIAPGLSGITNSP